MTIECQHGQLARACELCRLETRVMELESVLNSFDNPFLVGDVWQWTGPDPDDIDTVLKAPLK